MCSLIQCVTDKSLKKKNMGDTLRIPGQESAPTETSSRRTDTETYKAETQEFLDKAWGDEQWKPPATIPRRDNRGTPFPPNHPWTVGELGVLKDITIAALSRDILPLSALYEPGGAIFEAAAESEQPRWCIKVCADARRVVRESAAPRLTKKEVFDMVMAGTLDGQVQVRAPAVSARAMFDRADDNDSLDRVKLRCGSIPDIRFFDAFWEHFERKKAGLC